MQSNKSSKIKTQDAGNISFNGALKSVIKQENSEQDKSLNEVYFFEPQEISLLPSDFINSISEEQNDAEILCPKTECRNVEIFKDKSTFEEHFKEKHRKDKIIYGCVSCDYTCKKFNMLKNHLKKHILKKFHCSQCFKTFPQKSQLNSHKTLEHHVRVCRCKQEFDNIEAYLEHRNNECQSIMKTKYSAPGTFECDDCKKNFTSLSSLFTHRKMHNETPKFKCQICQKEFFQKINLTNHTKTHNAQNRNFSCEKCDKKFFERSHLQRHQNFHNMSRDFKCTECGKFYKTERCLKVHKQVHSEKRPFLCDLCNKGFLSSTKLKQHTNVHFNLRPFMCKHCPRDFTNYPNLLKHTIRRHKVDHRTGNPIVKVPAYVTNKKKNNKKNEIEVHESFQNSPILVTDDMIEDKHDISIIHISDEDFSQLPLSSGDFGDNDEDSAMHNYSSMILDIDQEFSDFQLLSPEKTTNDWNNIIDL